MASLQRQPPSCCLWKGTDELNDNSSVLNGRAKDKHSLTNTTSSRSVLLQTATTNNL